jgi:hypothetical protein
VITPVDHNDTITNVAAVIQQVEHHKTTENASTAIRTYPQVSGPQPSRLACVPADGLRRITNAEIRAKESHQDGTPSHAALRVAPAFSFRRGVSG